MKKETGLTDNAQAVVDKLDDCGCLLVSGDGGEANVMTIGWGQIGWLWGKPVFIVAVRPSRYTFGFMEKSGEFTVNVPSDDMGEVAEYCGSVSGRDVDKFEEKNLTLVDGKNVDVPTIGECDTSYECKVLYKFKLDPDDVPGDDVGKWYADNDYHTLYIGEIVTALSRQ